MQHNMMVRCKNIVRGSTAYVCILDEWVWGNSCKTDNRRRQLLTIITSKWQNMMKLTDCFIHKNCGCKHRREKMIAKKKESSYSANNFFLLAAAACVFPSSCKFCFVYLCIARNKMLVTFARFMQIFLLLHHSLYFIIFFSSSSCHCRDNFLFFFPSLIFFFWKINK